MRTLKSLVPALAIGSVLLLAACGGGGGSSSGASPATTAATTPSSDTGTSSGDGQGGGRSNLNDPAVQQCLADKGVTVPSFPRRGQGEAPPDSAANPEGGQNGGQGGAFPGMDDATRQALQDCGVTFGRGGQGGGGGGFGGAFNDPAVQQCLADRGITVPQRGAEQAPAEGSRPTIDDATRQAIQDCRAQATTTTTIAA